MTIPTSSSISHGASHWPVRNPFVRRQRAEQHDVDAFGHVNNLRYVDWAQEVAWGHSEMLGMSLDDFVQSGFAFVVQRHEFDYKLPVLDGQEVLIATWIAENDGIVRLNRAYEMRRPDDGALVFQGITRFVTVELASGRPVRMPAEWPGIFAPAELV
ncbi:MAG: thioesterase family protein [Pseudomonadota bacterium]